MKLNIAFLIFTITFISSCNKFNDPEPKPNNEEEDSTELVNMDTLINILPSNSNVAYPCWSPENEIVYFCSDENGNNDIYSYKLSNKEITQITESTYDELLPAVSPDGKQLTFQADKNGNSDIFTLNLLTNELKKISFSSEYDGHPSWSPDGNKIAFVSYESSNADIWMAHLTGDSIIYDQLTFSEFPDEHPSWNPYENKILYVTIRNENYDICEISIQTKEIEFLTETAENELYPSLINEGKTLLFASYKGDYCSIYRKSLLMGETKLIIDISDYDASPKCSYNEQYLAFHSYIDNINYNSFIYTLKPNQP
jgi:TolB protein